MTSRLPFEFLGLGRRFREEIADADDLAVRTMTRLFIPLARRADRSACPRPEMLQDTDRHWRKMMPQAGLLDRDIQLSRRELHIREVRVGAARDGETNEPVIVILLIELDVAPMICQLMVETAAVLSLHALGRWYQRASITTQAALFSDLARLASAYAPLLDRHAATSHPGFLLPAGNGQWAGSVTRWRSEVTGRLERILNIRTFLPEAAIESAAIWPDQAALGRSRIGGRGDSGWPIAQHAKGYAADGAQLAKTINLAHRG